MAANQLSNQKSKPGGGQQRSQQGHGGTQTKTSESSGTIGAVTQIAEQATDYVSRGASQVTEYAREHAGSSVIAALVTGFGIGLLIGHTLSVPYRKPRSWRDRIAAEGLGRRVLDRIESMLPDVVAEQLGR